MIFASVPAAEAHGALLAHSQVIGGKRLAKGRVLTEADIAAALADGILALTVARPGPEDISEDAAAAQLAAALAGPGVAALPARHGRANLAAQADGVVQIDPDMVRAVNGCDEAVTLATLAPWQRVRRGDIVATVKIIRYAVAAGSLARAATLVRPVSIAAFRSLRVTLIMTTLPGVADKAMARTLSVTRRRVEAIGSKIRDLPPCLHEVAALGEALGTADGDLLLVAGASGTVDRADVVPAAIVAAGGRVERLGMPVDPGNLLCLGYIAGRPVIGLPGCARSPRRNGFDIVLERLAAGLVVTSDDIAALGSGGLLPEAERPEPRSPLPEGRVGAVILAAGRSSRMGGAHKLLEPWNGRPLVAHVADAVAAAGLPAIVVLGHRAAEVRAALGDRPLVFVDAPDHEAGLSQSLKAGIEAVPPDWSAALICLGDMPRVEPALLAGLATAPGEVVVPTWQGKRGNPVRWARSHFAALAGLAGDVGGKALLAGLDPVLVPAPSDAILDDIDTPAALAALRAQ